MKLAIAFVALICCGNAYAAVHAGKVKTFGTGLSAATVHPGVELFYFNYTVTPGSFGVITHFWSTGGAGNDDIVFRYYLDGETEASIQFVPSVACGVGFNDEQAPWGTKWVGKGARTGGWFFNYKIPFQKTIRVSATLPSNLSPTAFYTIIRGVENVPIVIGDIEIPTNARMVQYRKENVVLQPLEYFNLVDAPLGTSGLLFMSTLVVQSGNLNFLEGCYHMYTPANAPFPGTLLSTGTEDYYDSAYYFDAGEFHDPVSGFTHLNTDKGIQWSAYRFHEMDPIVFQDGLQFRWRNGDANSPTTGLKCFTESGGITVGSPTVSNVTSYAWVYQW